MELQFAYQVRFIFRDLARSRMTDNTSYYLAARNWRMRAAETLALADEMKEPEPKAIMLRIVAEYERLAEWAEKNSTPFWLEKKRSQIK